jgi:Zn-dependent protease
LENFDFIRVLKYLPGIILGLTVHEYCHALVALKCGDSTSKDQGRITLNPIKHIDFLGFIMLIFVGFGWAKPVEFKEENLRNPKYDVIKIAIAGPISNALLAMILSVIFVICTPFIQASQTISAGIINDILIYAISINWALFVFNLIPLPPLDGSHLLFYQLRKYPAIYEALYKYGSYLFLGLIIASYVTNKNFLPIGPVIRFLGGGFLSLLGYHV